MVLAVWVLGWLVFRGKATLALGFQDQTSFHGWLNGLRDDIQLAATRGNWFFDGVIGTVSDFLNWVVAQAQQLVSAPAFPRPVPQIGWVGVLALLAWVGLRRRRAGGPPCWSPRPSWCSASSATGRRGWTPSSSPPSPC